MSAEVNKLAVPSVIGRIMAEVLDSGYEVWVVGGAVRDLIRGKSPYDWDLAVRASSDSMASLFPGARCLGKDSFKVWKFKAGNYNLEISSLKGPDILSDLAVRDFTVNAMALTSGGFLVDPFGGRRDTDCKLLRFTGDPAKRIEEDPLRLLRMCRLSSSLGFRIHTRHFALAEKQACAIERVCSERIGDEMMKGFKGQCGSFWELVTKAGLAAFLSPLPPASTVSFGESSFRSSELLSRMMVMIQDRERKCMETFSVSTLFLPLFMKSGCEKNAKIAEKRMISWGWPVKVRRGSIFFSHFARFLLSPLEAENIYCIYLRSGTINKLHGLFRFAELLVDALPVNSQSFRTSLENNRRYIPEIFDILDDKDIFLPAGEISRYFSVPPGPKLGFFRHALAIGIAEGRIKTRKDVLKFLASIR